MPHIGVILSGCGVYDGTEIHEAVCTLLALEQAGATYQCMAPDVEQMHVVDHLKGKPVPGAVRNVLTESARIARGDILALGDVQVAGYDGFFFPGGFGAAKNLSTFAVDGADCLINPDVARLVGEAHAAGKPIAFVCIAPVIAAKVFGAAGAKVTIGSDRETAAAIRKTGAVHVECPTKEAVVDTGQRIVTSPAYMTATSISEVYASVTAAVGKLLGLIGQAGQHGT